MYNFLFSKYVWNYILFAVFAEVGSCGGFSRFPVKRKIVHVLVSKGREFSKESVDGLDDRKLESLGLETFYVVDDVVD